MKPITISHMDDDTYAVDPTKASPEHFDEVTYHDTLVDAESEAENDAIYVEESTGIRPPIEAVI